MSNDTEPQWVTWVDTGDTFIENLDGVAWADAPAPGRWHRHQPQTRGILGFDLVERCACGAMRQREGRPWLLLDPPRRAPGVLGYLFGGAS